MKTTIWMRWLLACSLTVGALFIVSPTWAAKAPHVSSDATYNLSNAYPSMGLSPAEMDKLSKTPRDLKTFEGVFTPGPAKQSPVHCALPVRRDRKPSHSPKPPRASSPAVYHLAPAYPNTHSPIPGQQAPLDMTGIISPLGSYNLSVPYPFSTYPANPQNTLLTSRPLSDQPGPVRRDMKPWYALGGLLVVGGALVRQILRRHKFA
jgi:hypothetical protein